MNGQSSFQAHFASLVVTAWLAGSLGSALGAQSTESRAQVDREFHRQLRALADKCDELGLTVQAKETLKVWIDRDPRRQYLCCPTIEPSPKPAQPASDLENKWATKLSELRRQHAASLFELAKAEVAGGSAAISFRLLHEVLHHDPRHTEALRILGMVAGDSRTAVRLPRVTHPKYGWKRGTWWQIDSPHFQIATNADQQSGRKLAERLEEFNSVWRQLFFDYWSSREWLATRFAGELSPHPPERKHSIVLFRDHEEYLRQLIPAEPQIALTLGYYLKGNKTSYFYRSDDRSISVWYHEATHQLFQETGTSIRDVGEKWNFWVVEGIAVYLESTTKYDEFFTVGGFDSDRIQFLRSRVFGGERLMPITELSVLGRESLQQHPEIRKLYTQAAGLAHFLMDGQGDRNRDEFVQRLAEAYAGLDNPRTFSSLPGVSSDGFESDFRAFLQVSDGDLRFLGPAAGRRNLSLAGAKIQDESLKLLAGSDKLEWLDLAYTPITEVGIENLGPLPSLKQLTLVNTRVLDAVAAKLILLPSLEELDLSGTAITDQALPLLSKLSRLKTLRLVHTAVTDTGLEHLMNLRNLEELDVDRTAVTPEALSRLKVRLSKLR